MSFKTGDQVHVKYTLIDGEVLGAAVNEDSDFLFLVAYVDVFGADQQRYFKLEELEAV